MLQAVLLMVDDVREEPSLAEVRAKFEALPSAWVLWADFKDDRGGTRRYERLHVVPRFEVAALLEPRKPHEPDACAAFLLDDDFWRRVEARITAKGWDRGFVSMHRDAIMAEIAERERPEIKRRYYARKWTDRPPEWLIVYGADGESGEQVGTAADQATAERIADGLNREAG